MDYFPIFADLRGRAVLLAGAGQVAQRKAESLMQAGAQVRVAAETLNPQFSAWLAQGRIRHVGTAFDAAFLAEVFLVVAATDDNALNQKIFLSCERAGKLCNTVDAREKCSFIVPAVIDRSPVQVAVSSGGSAPVLARKIRTQIETLLPLHIGRAAAWAGKWRGRVKAAVAGLPQRRRFWEKLFDGDFMRYAAAGDEARADAELLRGLADDVPPRRGFVTLAGAGPGDAGLLTLNALHALQAADVVLYDALVSGEILAMARRDAEKICVGKRAGSHSVQQEETNRLLLRFAREGRQVVRLKGGDPFVFGRGGEECQVLAAAGVDFAVIPGITAALGAAAAAGIPLTHRDYAHGVQLVTAHGQKADTPDWAGLARGGQTLVVYMGTLNAGEIAAQLTAHGRCAETPAAVVSHATRANQSVRTGCLKDLAALAENAPMPALLIIGEVVALRQQRTDSAASAARAAQEKGEIQAA